jgi:hypothetical protein
MCGTALGGQQLLSSYCQSSPHAQQQRNCDSQTADINGASLLCRLDRIIVPVHEGLHWTAIMADLANK